MYEVYVVNLKIKSDRWQQQLTKIYGSGFYDYLNVQGFASIMRLRLLHRQHFFVLFHYYLLLLSLECMLDTGTGGRQRVARGVQ